MAAIPIRTCIGCRGKFVKSDLLRFVRDATGSLRADSTGKSPGRGGYVCRTEACISAALKVKKINAHLRVSLPTPALNEFKQALLELVSQENVEEV